MNENVIQQKKSIKVPDLPVELYKDQSQDITHITSSVPPFISTTERIVSEKNNSDPNFIRFSLYSLPISEFGLESCAIPLTMIATPFNDKGIITPVNGLDYCKECRTTFNSFTQVDNQYYICNICKHKNSVVPRFTDNFNYASVESVIQSNAESSPFLKTVDLLSAPVIQYPHLPTILKPTFYFIFNLASFNCSQAFEYVANICSDESFKFFYENIGFILLGKSVTFFSIKNGHPTKYVFNGTIPFIHPNCTVKSEDLTGILAILEEMSGVKDETIPANISIVNTLRMISSFTVACKIAFFGSFTSNFEYESLLQEKKNFSINVFNMSADAKKKFKITNSLEKLAFFTGGQIFRYLPADSHHLAVDLKNICLARSAFDVKLILKVSDNLEKIDCIGQTLDNGIARSHMNHMDASSAFTFHLGLDGASKEAKHVHLQVSFIDYDGIRKIRIFNHCLETGTPSQLFLKASFDTIFASYVKISLAEDSSIESAFVKALVYYRNKCSSSASDSQFVLPESLKCLPVLVNSFAKKDNIDTSMLIGLNVEQTLRYFYPRLFSLSDYILNGDLNKTKSLRLTIDSIHPEEIYILENGERILIYFPKDVDPQLIEAMISDKNGYLQIRSSDTEESEVMNQIINSIQEHYNKDLKVTICLAGSEMYEAEFISFMMEDAINGLPDYVDYVFKLHFQIRNG